MVLGGGSGSETIFKMPELFGCGRPHVLKSSLSALIWKSVPLVLLLRVTEELTTKSEGSTFSCAKLRCANRRASYQFTLIWTKNWEEGGGPGLVSLRPQAAECLDTEACDFQILTIFTQPHRLCSWSQSEIYQNLDSNSAATLGPRAQVNCTSNRYPEI